jgi:hypothetical protein
VTVTSRGEEDRRRGDRRFSQAPPDELLELLERELLEDDELELPVDDELLDEVLLEDELVEDELLDAELLEEELMEDELLDEELLADEVLDEELLDVPLEELLEPVELDGVLEAVPLLEESASGDVGVLVQPARPAASAAAGAPDSSSRKSRRLVRSVAWSSGAGAGERSVSDMYPPTARAACPLRAGWLAMLGWGTGGAPTDRWRGRVQAALLR